jgi:hypothetical protein
MKSNIVNWWTTHVRRTAELVKGVVNGNPAQVDREADYLKNGALLWSRFVGHVANNLTAGKIANDLMWKHILLVKVLTEAGMEKDQVSWDNTLRELLSNMREQANFLNSVIYGFDKWKFLQLFKEHLVFTGGYIKAAVNQNTKEFVFDLKMALRNASQFDHYTESIFQGGGI